ncbi:hypothetical protein B0O99DRAFT_694161 [Bisporella sp. PMI_857]|nr:hypothetical protein B0O99DRAFT_694905 [Bisporella sp. PMI_857]KAH8587819.1 hypothetical protein B0O99DRAFT_694161 [Bisporella sp. PMI_857]
MSCQYAERLADHSLDSGPFALVHGDLELILDGDMNIVSVLDWEWSRVVPASSSNHPLWLSSAAIDDLSYGFRYKHFLKLFDKFLAILRALERRRYKNELLANE